MIWSFRNNIRDTIKIVYGRHKPYKNISDPVTEIYDGNIRDAIVDCLGMECLASNFDKYTKRLIDEYYKITKKGGIT